MIKKKSVRKSSSKQIIKDIKSLKIQGATNVAKAALKVLHNEYLKDNSEDHVNQIIAELYHTRPTEPMMHNSLKYYLHLIKKTEKTPRQAYKTVNNYFEYS